MLEDETRPFENGRPGVLSKLRQDDASNAFWQVEPLIAQDRQLLDRCLNRETGAWTEFVDRFLGLVFHVIQYSANARNITLSAEQTEDIAAEVMTQLCANDFAALKRFRGESSLATYLTVLARRICIAKLPRQETGGRTLDDDVQAEPSRLDDSQTREGSTLSGSPPMKLDHLKIVILEDNDERIRHMRTALADRLYMYEPRFFTAPAEMIEFLKLELQNAIAISLDHDLELEQGPDGRLVDPGTGREVADFLSTQEPTCPVLLHSTNTSAVEGMRSVLENAGWEVHRVVPANGHAWIETAWLRSIRNAIVRFEKHVETASKR